MCGALATSAPVAVEDGAGEVEPLLDVDRIGGVLQRHAHLLGDRHEEVVEDLEHDRVGLGAERGLALLLLDAAQQDVVPGGDLGLPARLDDDGLVALDEQRRAVDAVAAGEVLAAVDGGIAARRRCRRRGGSRRASRRRRDERPVGLVAAGDAAVGGLDLDRLDDHRLVVVDEAELRLVRRLEIGARLVDGAGGEVDRQRRVGAVVADVQDRAARRRRRRERPAAAVRRTRRRAASSMVASRSAERCLRRAAGSGACWREAKTLDRPMP